MEECRLERVISVTQLPVDRTLRFSSRKSLEAQLERSRAREFELESALSSALSRGRVLAHELDLFRQRRAVQWSDRFRSRFDAWHLLSPPFQQLKDDTRIFSSSLSGFRLLPSINLGRVACLEYQLDLGRSGLSAVLLAPLLDMPFEEGALGLRLLSSRGKLLAESTIPLIDVSDRGPALIEFPAVRGSDEKISVQIFACRIDGPVRILELRKYPLRGFGRAVSNLFAGYQFKD